MVITEEIIAAYVEGKLSEKERKEVLHYMVIHPEVQDVVLALLDESDLEEPTSDNDILDDEVYCKHHMLGSWCNK